MKQTFFHFTIMVLIFLYSTFTTAQVSIPGKVIDINTDLPIQNATISIISKSGEPKDIDVTDDLGRFHIEREDFSYGDKITIIVNKSPYEKIEKKYTISSEATILLLGLSTETEKTISGHVYDSMGKEILPIRNARVYYRGESGRWIYAGLTDSLGDFSFEVKKHEAKIRLTIDARPKYKLEEFDYKIPQSLAILEDVLLESMEREIRVKVINHSDKKLIKNLDIKHFDSFTEKNVIEENGIYKFQTKRCNGESINIVINNSLGHELIMPKTGDFQDITIYTPKIEKGKALGFGIGTVALFASGVISKGISNKAYKEHFKNPTGENMELYKKANNWNRASIFTTALGTLSAVSFSIVISSNKHKKAAPKIFYTK